LGQLLLEQILQLAPGQIVNRLAHTRARPGLLVMPSLRSVHGCFPGDARGDTVQPAGDGLASSDRSRISGQDQECRLVTIFRILFMVEDLPANAPDQSPMALDQLGKGSLVMAATKALQKLTIAQGCQLPLSQDGLQLSNSGRQRRSHLSPRL